MTLAKTVLIVDDEDELRRLMAEDVAYLGFQVCEAGGVDEAKERLSTLLIDIVLTDLRMPGESGMDLLQWILARPEPRPRMIVYSGLVDPGSRQQMLAQGVAAVLEKPYSEEDLVKALQSTLTT